MAIKHGGYGGHPRLLYICDAQIGTMIMSKWIPTAPLFPKAMVGNMVDLIKK